jgi:hypothetical protein
VLRTILASSWTVADRCLDRDRRSAQDRINSVAKHPLEEKSPRPGSLRSNARHKNEVGIIIARFRTHRLPLDSFQPTKTSARLHDDSIQSGQVFTSFSFELANYLVLAVVRSAMNLVNFGSGT